MSSFTKPSLVLLHGWAVNSSIWSSVIDGLDEHFNVIPIDLPGYGDRHQHNGDLTLQQLTLDVLAQSPPGATWMAWSLGATVALNAAIESPGSMAELKLVCPTPKFVASDDWEHGITQSAMDNLADRFKTDYATALKRFLLMQAGTNANARSLAKSTLQQILASPHPRWETLNSGLDLLRRTDLRQSLPSVTTPTQIIVGRQDRVTPAGAGAAIQQSVVGSQLVEIDCGHAPFVERPDTFLSAVVPR